MSHGSDELHLADYRIPLNRSKERAQSVDVAELPREVAARSKRKPSTCISSTQYRSESMINRKVRVAGVEAVAGSGESLCNLGSPSSSPVGGVVDAAEVDRRP
jgi:hypothetical protein